MVLSCCSSIKGEMGQKVFLAHFSRVISSVGSVKYLQIWLCIFWNTASLLPSAIYLTISFLGPSVCVLSVQILPQQSCPQCGAVLGKKLGWWVWGVHKAQTILAPCPYMWSVYPLGWTRTRKGQVSVAVLSGPQTSCSLGTPPFEMNTCCNLFSGTSFTFPLLHCAVVVYGLVFPFVFLTFVGITCFIFFVDAASEVLVLLS